MENNFKNLSDQGNYPKLPDTRPPSVIHDSKTKDFGQIREDIDQENKLYDHVNIYINILMENGCTGGADAGYL